MPALVVLAGVSAGLWLAIPRLPPGPVVPPGPAAEPAPTAPAPNAPEPSPTDRLSAAVERLCRGRCVDGLDGRPLAGLTVQLGEVQAATDRDGVFVVHLPDGEPAALRISGGDVVPVERLVRSPDAPDEPDAHDGRRVELELGELSLRRGASLSGWLLDAQRQPVANAELVALLAQPWRHDGSRECFATTATTIADGAFQFVDPLPAGELVLALRDRTKALAEARCQLAAGEALQVTLQIAEVEASERPAGALVDADAPGPELLVVDAEGGTPIERFAWRWQPESGASREPAVRPLGPGHHPGGRCRVGRATAPHTLVVWPEDPRWLPSWRHAVVAGPGERIQVALPRATDFEVTVRTRSGRAVPRVHVELLRGRGDGVVHPLTPPNEPGFGPHDTVRLAAARGDANGRAVLRWWRDPEPHTLRLTGPGLAHDVAIVLATERHEVVVPDTGRVQFRLQGAGGSFVTMQSHEGGSWPPRSAQPFALDEQGEGLCELPVGTYDVSLATPTPDGRDGRAITLASFATVTIRHDVEVELARDLRLALQPARLSVVLLVDGEPRSVRLWGRSGAAADSHRLPVTFLAGTSHFDALPAGSYRPFVRLDCGGQAVDWPLADWTTLAPRATLQLGPILLRTTELVLQLEDRFGTPVHDGTLLLCCPTGGALAGRPDARGLVQLRGIPAASYTLQFRRGDADRELGTIDAGDPHARRRFVVDR